jgi:hypothetical protein
MWHLHHYPWVIFLTIASFRIVLIPIPIPIHCPVAVAVTAWLVSQLPCTSHTVSTTFGMRLFACMMVLLIGAIGKMPSQTAETTLQKTSKVIQISQLATGDPRQCLRHARGWKKEHLNKNQEPSVKSSSRSKRVNAPGMVYSCSLYTLWQQYLAKAQSAFIQYSICEDCFI